MKIKTTILIVILSFSLVITGYARAQEEQPVIELKLIRNFGYGGLGEIQGRFTLKPKNYPTNLTEVMYYVDEDLVYKTKTPPFEYKFHTDDFNEGKHTFFAIGILSNGTRLQAKPFSKVFLSSEQAWGETQRLIVPLLLFTGVLTLIGVGAPLLLSRKKDFVVGRYGPAGGAVCTRCGLPFSRPVFAPNLLVGKLLRCPHCGKLSIQARAGADRLHEAETRYLNPDPGRVSTPDQRGYLDLLDESRFED